MTDNLQTLREDIGFLRELAEVGRSPNLAGGSMLVAAGTIFGLASVAHWAIATGWAGAVSPWAFLAIWVGAMAAFVCALAALKRTYGDASAGQGSRAMKLAWQAMGWTIFVLFICSQIIAWRLRSTLPLVMLPSVILSLYGLAWMVVAGVSRQPWVWRTAIGAFLAAGAAAFLCQSAGVFLLFAAAMVCLAVIPGLVMIRQSHRDA
jgi:hypothetical protein